MIRMIKDKDIQSVTEIYNWYIVNSTATFEIQELENEIFKQRIKDIRKQYPWLVLEIDNKVIGYAYLSKFNDRAAYDWTCDLAIYIDHNCGHLGYGTKLMKAIIDLAKKDGYKKMISIVTSENNASMSLHEKFDFEKMATFENIGFKHNRWLGVIYYQLDLNPTDNKLLEPPLNLNYNDDEN